MIVEIDPNLPIDKTSAIVVSRHNEAQFSKSNGMRISSVLPIPFYEFDAKNKHLTGKRVGRLTILGRSYLSTNSRRKRGLSRFVVRCDCGRYEVRNRKAILRTDAMDKSLMCNDCCAKHKLKEKEYWLRTGMNHCYFCGKSFNPDDLKEHHKTKCS